MPKYKVTNRKKMKLSEVFDNEMDFSNELSENYLEQIEEIIDVSLEHPRREERAGKYSIDILCDIKGSEDKELVIIENQREGSDHTHLGQCITYASSKKAKIVVWICEYFEDEHITALEWLNEYFGGNVNFYGIKIEIYNSSSQEKQINFIPIVTPNNQVFIESNASKPYYAPRLKFFGKTIEKYNKISTFPAKRKPTIKNTIWVYIGNYVGIDLRHRCSENVILAGLKIWKDDDDEKWRDEIFEILNKNKEKIQNIFGEIRWFDLDKFGKSTKRKLGFAKPIPLSKNIEDIDENEMEKISNNAANIMKKMRDIIEELKLEE